MRKLVFLILFFIFIGTISIFACDIVVGQTYNYEWKIVNIATGEQTSSGAGTIVPSTNQGYRNIEHYIRRNVFGWSNWTRTISGVRERLTVIVADCDI